MEDKKLFCGDFANTALGRKTRENTRIEDIDKDDEIDAESDMHRRMTSEPVPATPEAIPF